MTVWLCEHCGHPGAPGYSCGWCGRWCMRLAAIGAYLSREAKR